MAAHERPFLVVPHHGQGSPWRVLARSLEGAARKVFARLGRDRPLLVHDRETGETLRCWTPVEGDSIPRVRICACGAPIRPTGRRGHPWLTCEACRQNADTNGSTP